MQTQMEKYLLNMIDTQQYNIPEITETSFKVVKKTIKKVMVVPFVRYNNSKHVLVFHDKRFNEWTFMSGTVEKGEDIKKCAERELREESENLLNLDFDKYDYSYFQTSFYEHKKLMKYHVFFIDITKTHLYTFKQYENHYKTKRNNENDTMKFENFINFQHYPNIWGFVEKKIINNFYVHQLLEL